MNIAMVSVQSSPLHAGVPHWNHAHENHAVHVAELARELGRLGHQVTVYTHQDGSHEAERVEFAPGVVVEHVAAGDAAPMSEQEMLPHVPDFARHLARRWSAERPDVVHAHHWLGGLAALSGARGLDLPIVQTYHELATLERRAGLPGWTARMRLEKAIGRSVRAVIATTGSERAGLVDLGVPRPRVATVPSGVDIETFTPEGPALPRGDAARILMITRPAGHQGVATVIQALTRIPGAELVVAGGPALEDIDDDKDIRRLRTVAERTGVADRVTFLGRVAHDEIPALLRSANLTVSLPTYETFGRVPLESMACGVPVVVSAVGGHLDSVIDEVTGTHVRPGRPVELARHIRTLLADPTRLDALGIAAVDRVQSRYSWERIAHETLKVYEAVCPTAEPVTAVVEEASAEEQLLAAVG